MNTEKGLCHIKRLHAKIETAVASCIKMKIYVRGFFYANPGVVDFCVSEPIFSQ